MRFFFIIQPCLFLLFAGKVTAQDVTLKTNALYWGTGTPNIAIEIAASQKYSIALEGGIQPWQYSDTKKLKHWLVQPEFRYWPCDVFNGHFFGIHALGGQFNAGGIRLPFGLFPSLETHRYQGWAVGAGLAYGYQWMLSRRWSLELTAGLGYLYIDYKKYACLHCGKAQKDTHRNYLGPTKVAINLIYVLK